MERTVMQALFGEVDRVVEAVAECLQETVGERELRKISHLLWEGEDAESSFVIAKVTRATTLGAIAHQQLGPWLAMAKTLVVRPLPHNLNIDRGLLLGLLESWREVAKTSSKADLGDLILCIGNYWHPGNDDPKYRGRLSQAVKSIITAGPEGIEWMHKVLLTARALQIHSEGLRTLVLNEMWFALFSSLPLQFRLLYTVPLELPACLQ